MSTLTFITTITFSTNILIDIYQGSNGQLYKINGSSIYYDIHFPIEWATQQKYGPAYCNGCRFSCVNGVFISYCMNCVFYGRTPNNWSNTYLSNINPDTIGDSLLNDIMFQDSFNLDIESDSDYISENSLDEISINACSSDNDDLFNTIEEARINGFIEERKKIYNNI